MLSEIYICYIFHISHLKVKCFAPWLELDSREEALTTDKVRPPDSSLALLQLYIFTRDVNLRSCGGCNDSQVFLCFLAEKFFYE